MSGAAEPGSDGQMGTSAAAKYPTGGEQKYRLFLPILHQQPAEAAGNAPEPEGAAGSGSV